MVYVVDGGKSEAMEAESLLRKFGVEKMRCYFEGISEWTKAGGKIVFPRFIKFQVSQENICQKFV